MGEFRKIPNLLIYNSTVTAAPLWSYPSLPQRTLQLRQLGDGTPGLGNQAFVSDGGATEV